ncbi:MAG: ATP-dependent DNA ligase [Saprospiraceae bacterium]|nr:ATP-dependent DNA ligase [Saprospiraceae bacterium]
MKLFAQLFTDLDRTTSTLQKVNLLAQYFKNALSDEDRLWAIALFTHRRPSRTVNTTLLRTWCAKEAGIPLWLFEENYHIIGDLAETIALLYPGSTKTSQFTLTYWVNYISDLKNCDEQQKFESITNAWNQLDSGERLIFNKLITGGFRIGVSDKLLVKALSVYTRLEENLITHKLMGNWSPDVTTFQKLIFEESEVSLLSRPYPFYLAYPLSEMDTENNESQLNPETWAAEWKWDGIRCQFIKRKGHIFMWSRGEELITNKFPEFLKSETVPDNIVLDGELVAFKDDKPLDFNVLQTRLGRKTISSAILKSAPACFIAFDILEYENQDIRHLAFEERRKILETIAHKWNDNNHFQLSPLVHFDSLEQLKQKRATARNTGAEGLMLKKQNGTYLAGRKTGEMWKWKLDPYTIDAVMIYAQRGHGRRANLFSDFTFAVWDNDRLVPFTKAYSGLTDIEMTEITQFVKKNTLENFGPVSSVKPELVFEIAFEGINESKRHKAGVALRFPRIKLWRRDKSADNANSLEDLKKLLEIY